MFENITKFFKRIVKAENKENKSGKEAKERLHLVLMQDRANVSADFLEMMKQEIIEVIKKYIDVDENAIDVRLTNQTNNDGTNGAPALYANIPIINIKEEKNNDKQESNDIVEDDGHLNHTEAVTDEAVTTTINIEPNTNNDTLESNDDVGSALQDGPNTKNNTAEQKDNIGDDCINPEESNDDVEESKE